MLYSLIDKLEKTNKLNKDELLLLLKAYDNPEISNYISEKARLKAQNVFQNNIYIRGLIEFTNYCKNNCLYCGIRAENKIRRYRLTKDEIMSSAKAGYSLGLRTFVLQGGEDVFFTDDIMCDIISSLKNKYSDCALTLSFGEKPYESYKKYFDCGADRYLLRHETITDEHYSMLHPKNLTIKSRVECLNNLKKIGFQTGCGFMVGSPFQTDEYIANDLLFISSFNPEMVGIGPFIPHSLTPFAKYPTGSVEKTLFILSIVRLMLPNALIPATTALSSASDDGRKRGILHGANVIMPNLSPMQNRKDYLLYNNKKYTETESADALKSIEKELSQIGYKISYIRGDYFKNE